jgi:hypothetical protein
MKVIVVKDCVIIVDGIADSDRRQNEFRQRGQPWKEFLLNPDKVVFGGIDELAKTAPIRSRDRSKAAAAILEELFNIFIAQKVSYGYFDACLLQAVHVLKKTQAACRTQAGVTG